MKGSKEGYCLQMNRFSRIAVKNTQVFSCQFFILSNLFLRIVLHVTFSKVILKNSFWFWDGRFKNNITAAIKVIIYIPISE